MKYKNFDIETEGFKSMLPNVDGIIAKFIIKSKNSRNVFFFAVASSEIDTKNLEESKLLEEASQIIKNVIDNLKDSQGYYYEYHQNNFIIIEKPTWKAK